MAKSMIDPKKRPPKEGMYKCGDCGYETPITEPYHPDCSHCHYGQLMGRWWGGWKRTVREQREYLKYWREFEADHTYAPVSQETEAIENFTNDERQIHQVLTFSEFGQTAPWLSPFGACFVRIYGIRRTDDGSVEFGIGNVDPPILGWVHAKDFYDEWPQ